MAQAKKELKRWLKISDEMAELIAPTFRNLKPSHDILEFLKQIINFEPPGCPHIMPCSH